TLDPVGMSSASSTTPEPSTPPIYGNSGRIRNVPEETERSRWLSAAACILTSTSPGPRCDTFTFATHGAGPQVWNLAAFIASKAFAPSFFMNYVVNDEFNVQQYVQYVSQETPAAPRRCPQFGSISEIRLP